MLIASLNSSIIGVILITMIETQQLKMTKIRNNFDLSRKLRILSCFFVSQNVLFELKRLRYPHILK